MIRTYFNILTVIFLTLPAFVRSQGNPMTLSEQELLNIVRSYHPVALQTGLSIQMAKADLQAARAAFDPVLHTAASAKELGGINYYSYRQAELKIPTWYGIEFNSGIENIGGTFTDPQRTLNSSSYAGVSFSLLKNLVTDKRRAALKQAKIMVNLSENEQQAMLNDLLYDALSVYWTWVQYYREWTVVNEAIEVIQQRVAYTRKMVDLGERPAIDSIEALTQLQYAENLRSELLLQTRQALIQLSGYTWKEGSQPYMLPDDLIPAQDSLPMMGFAPELPAYPTLLQEALSNHPDLRSYQFKFRILDIQKKLKFQELLPDVKVKYNQLGKNYALNETLFQPLLQNNYQYGLSFSMPLRLSEARAGYRQAKLKINSTEYEFELKKRSIENKLREQFNTLTQLGKQITWQQQLYRNQQTLQKGEEIRFENGESSLFLINSREQKSIESLQKLNATWSKYRKQMVGLKWAAGLLWKE